MLLFAMQPCLSRPAARAPQQTQARAGIRRPHRHGKLRTCAPRAASQEVAASVTEELLDAIKGSQRGLQTSPEALQRIEQAIAKLETLPSSGSQDAAWEMLWTTEKETLWILKNSGWLGGKAGKVYQIIDTAQGYLQNVITFPPESAFVVDSTIQPEGARRTNFKFSSATLQLPARAFQLPPFGKGWFDNVYMDDRIRVSKDIRGDTLVTVRAGPPRRFANDLQ